MGAKDSKPCFLSYEDAVKRVTDAELKRLKDAFKRSSTLTGHMPKNVFIREVLGEGVPQRLAEHIYTAFGGTVKGLTYKDLTCGLVLLTRGRLEEKIKFIFGLYANENLSSVQKEHMDKMVLATEGTVPQSLSQLFLESDKVNFDHFREWLLNHPDSTTLTKWLLKEPCSVTLSNDSETPTFYQTLAGVTHLEEADILELEKRYWVLKGQSKTGRFDLETFKPMVCPPIPESLCEGVFNAFDENRDNHIDFKEIACGISACCRGPLVERLKFCFKIFDTNCDGLLSKEDLITMIAALLDIRKDNRTQADWMQDKFRDVEPKTLVEGILQKFSTNKGDHLSLDEYLLWSSSHPLPQDFLELLFQVSHVVLGLKPATPEEEESVILGWVERESRHGLQLHSTWYLVAMQWWGEWRDYVSYPSKGQHQLKNNAVTNHYQSNSYPNSPSPSSNRKSATLPRKQKKNSLNPSFNTGSYAWEDNSDVVVTHYKTELSPKANGVPGRSNSLPRNGNSGVILNPRELSATPSPSASPHLGRKYSGVPPRPGQIDNSPLIIPNTYKVATLTNEGGRLKKNVPLVRGRDYELLPEPVWKALCSWYGGSPALPRTVISMGPNLQPDLELYPITTKLLRHQIPAQRPNTTTTFTGMMTGLGGMALNVAGLGPPATPRRYLAYTACFSRKHTLKQVSDYLCTRLRIGREDLRLWKYKDEQNMVLLEDDEMTMEELNIEEQQQILIEVRNKDLTWPEEMSSLVKNKTPGDKKQQAPTTQGATGLNNLGNTCFMNSAVQCVSNTRALTEYFRYGKHLYELNRDNPLGMKGHIAQRYGDLVKNLWTGTSKTIAPLKLRWTIGKYAPRFNGFQQHDAQELLAFLLDGLHEDLNRVHNKPYVELKDSDGRPDEVVAREAWENHLVRNKSIVVDLFHGQLKSQVRCMACGHISVRFDPFTYLSLPLPMESCIHLEIIVICRDGSVPVKYGVRLNMDEKYRLLKKQLSDLSGIPQQQLLLVELIGAVVKSFPHDSQKIRSALSGALYAYELPPVPEITPMSAMEERVLAKEHMALRDIQRMTTSVNNNETTKEYGGQSKNEVIKETESENGMGDMLREAPQITVNGTDTPAVNTATQPGHSRNASNCSIGSSITTNNNGSLGSDPEISGFLVAVHRKMIRMDVYFLSSQKTRPSLFGTPLIIPCNQDTTHQDLYQSVWVQVSRLVSPLPPSESGHPNHAQDCDDSLGYEYPFTLKAVQKDGFTCAWCPWYRFCRGCKLECTTDDFNNGSCYIAVDWEPTALHLRYQSSQERVYNDHESVEESRRLQTEPIDLDACLRAFTKEEELGEEELYYCSKCKELRLAAKKLDIWKLPPILIIHLKRFQFLNNRWVKSHKIVKFPIKHFDPSSYLAPRMPKQEVVSKIVEVQEANHNEQPNHVQPSDCQCGEVYTTCGCESENRLATGDERPVLNGDLSDSYEQYSDTPVEGSHDPFTNCNGGGLTHSGSTYDNLPETEGATAAMELDDILDEYNPNFSGRHRMTSVASMDYTTARYDLYALSCHSGILGGGHYVSYAKNPNKKWYCYNDSSCKEITEDQIDTDSAYMLFYERRDLDYNRYLPDVRGKEPCVEEDDEEFESDFKKMCTVQ